MAFKVVANFNDLKDNGYEYRVGDVYPHSGFSVSDERLKELSGSNNKQGKPLITEVVDEDPKEEPKEKKPRGRRKKGE